MDGRLELYGSSAAAQWAATYLTDGPWEERFLPGSPMSSGGNGVASPVVCKHAPRYSTPRLFGRGGLDARNTTNTRQQLGWTDGRTGAPTVRKTR